VDAPAECGPGDRNSVVPIPVDDDGLVSIGSRLGVRAVLVRAAHQFPLGVVLAPDRRVELVEWARRSTGCVGRRL